MERSSPGHQQSERFLSGDGQEVPIVEDWCNRSDRESKKVAGRSNESKRYVMTLVDGAYVQNQTDEDGDASIAETVSAKNRDDRGKVKNDIVFPRSAVFSHRSSN